MKIHCHLFLINATRPHFLLEKKNIISFKRYITDHKGNGKNACVLFFDNEESLEVLDFDPSSINRKKI